MLRFESLRHISRVVQTTYPNKNPSNSLVKSTSFDWLSVCARSKIICARCRISTAVSMLLRPLTRALDYAPGAVPKVEQRLPVGFGLGWRLIYGLAVQVQK